MDADRDAAGPGPGETLSALALDADPALAREPRLLVDPRFLGILHFELCQKVGPEQAALNLLQLGFLRGLRDATRLLSQGLAAPSIHPVAPMSPLLALRLDGGRHLGGDDGWVEGTWPDRPEANARLATMGPAPHPVCWASAGYTSGWLSGLEERDVLAVETRCVACGAEACRFVARPAEDWRARGDLHARELLGLVAFDDLREVVRREESAPGASSSSMEVDSPAIHVWGPVMVLPFSGADESLRAVELIGTDPEARAVSVVVLDLDGVILDEAFGAVALERTLDAIESWGAEPILAGVTPLSERVVTDLERSHVLLRKGLAEAVATAFQIVDAQRHPC